MNSTSDRLSCVQQLTRRYASAFYCISLICLSAANGVVAGPGVPAFRSWLDIRDAGVERQQRDYSCGVASLATILKYSYGMTVSEVSLLQLLEQGDRNWRLPVSWEQEGVSLAVLAELARYHNFQAEGVAVDANMLARLSVPAIAYMEYHGIAHFTVIRGVSAEGWVHLADPSWGNRRLSLKEFLPLWQVDKTTTVKKGRLLLMRPELGNPARLNRHFYDPKVLRPLIVPMGQGV